MAASPCRVWGPGGWGCGIPGISAAVWHHTGGGGLQHGEGGGGAWPPYSAGTGGCGAAHTSWGRGDGERSVCGAQRGAHGCGSAVSVLGGALRPFLPLKLGDGSGLGCWTWGGSGFHSRSAFGSTVPEFPWQSAEAIADCRAGRRGLLVVPWKKARGCQPAGPHLGGLLALRSSFLGPLEMGLCPLPAPFGDAPCCSHSTVGNRGPWLCRLRVRLQGLLPPCFGVPFGSLELSHISSLPPGRGAASRASHRGGDASARGNLFSLPAGIGAAVCFRG